MNTKQLVRAALMAALCLVLTRVVTIPAPTGYINLGDCALLLSAWILSPVYAGMAAGIGSMLADFLSGYAAYAPATFVIKFVMAIAAAWLFKNVHTHNATISAVVGSLVAEMIMVCGYFFYESAVLGVGAAAVASLPANVIQGIAGIISGVIMISAWANFDAGRRNC